MKRAAIKYTGSYIPELEVKNSHVESRLKENGYDVPEGLFAQVMGSETRYYAAETEQASDLAVAAAKKVLKQFPKEDVDLLIFAAACGDLIEPATANIVQSKLGLTCPVFDVKNACNSVVNAMQIADAFIQTGQYRNILIASGEKTSDSIKYDIKDHNDFKDRFASYSFGDAGFAALLTESNKEGFQYHNQISYGEHWPLCTIKGGGSMFPHEPSQLFFSGLTYELRNIFMKYAPEFINDCLKQADKKVDEIDLVCTHQVSNSTFDQLAQSIDCHIDKISRTFSMYGNTAATALPISLEHAIKNNEVGKGSTVMMVGLAAGINISVQLMTL